MVEVRRRDVCGGHPGVDEDLVGGGTVGGLDGEHQGHQVLRREEKIMNGNADV